MKSGKVNEAAQDLKQVIGSLPNSAPAHFRLAAVYGAQRLPHSGTARVTSPQKR